MCTGDGLKNAGGGDAEVTELVVRVVRAGSEEWLGVMGSGWYCRVIWRTDFGCGGGTGHRHRPGLCGDASVSQLCGRSNTAAGVRGDVSIVQVPRGVESANDAPNLSARNRRRSSFPGFHARGDGSPWHPAPTSKVGGR
jgi:hypothetical protein